MRQGFCFRSLKLYSGVANAEFTPHGKIKFLVETLETIMVEPKYPRTINMVEGFHHGLRTRVIRERPTVQEYLREIRGQQVTIDSHQNRHSARLILPKSVEPVTKISTRSALNLRTTP
jgi:hypothetical protein